LVGGQKILACSYPFGLHKLHSVPWDVIVKGDGLIVKSTACHTKISDPSADACSACSDLLHHNILQGILERIEHGVYKHTRYEYLNTSNLHELLLRKNEQINCLKLSQLNLERSIAARARPLEAFKRFVLAVGKGDIPRLHQLVSTAHRNGSSIYAIMEKIDMATRQAYHPKGYSEKDFKRLFLFHKLGGAVVAELAHRTLGLPSIDATRRHIGVQPLHVSPKMPTLREMKLNLDISFPPSDSNISTTPTHIRKSNGPGYQLMADEIKIEERLRWNARNNDILGVCREHSCNYSLEFRSIDQPNVLIQGIVDGDVHLATEV
jgi:hypothetical protein